MISVAVKTGSKITRERKYVESESKEDKESLDSVESEQEMEEEHTEKMSSPKRKRTWPQLATRLESALKDCGPDLKADDCMNIISGLYMAFLAKSCQVQTNTPAWLI